MGRPVVGLCAVRERARWALWDQDAHLVADSYVRAVSEAGAVAVLLPVDPRAPLELLDRIDALMLVGGADVDPASYGAQRDPATESTYPQRDSFEIALTLAALERELPYLGICRGMQIMNVALGGTLVQNLAVDGGENPHRRVPGSFEASINEVALEPGSLAASALGEERHTAVCHHHQAIDRLGDGLVISGRAVIDDIVEAVELTNGSWGLGVQWHPEAAERRQLFHVFAEVANGS
jgi:putative glutamine amidotransferase